MSQQQQQLVEAMMPSDGRIDQELELYRCRSDPFYFIDNYCFIHSSPTHTNTAGAWIPFKLWNQQAGALDVLHNNRLIIILKARQLGFSWLVVCYSLWFMWACAGSIILLFSKRDDEAIELLSFRMKGVYQRLPGWLQVPTVSSSGHQWQLENGSRAIAFPTTGGRSYTGSLVIVDEADNVRDLNDLLNAVKPTIDAGGKLILLSTVDKSRPMSPFKMIYNGAVERKSDFLPIFCPWSARPERTPEWYDAQRRDILARTGALDDLYQEYPSTDAEALAPKVLDKRFAPGWLVQCYRQLESIPDARLPEGAPAVPGLVVYTPPKVGRRYVVGADPAEGNPTSDDSAFAVLDLETGEEVALFAEKAQPSTFADYIGKVAVWYNHAQIMCERNNHGHAVLLWLRSNCPCQLLTGHDANVGWLSSAKGKALLYDDAADALRNNDVVIHSLRVFNQLASIDGATLRAPEGLHDDIADAFALACVASLRGRRQAWNFGAASPSESMIHRLPNDVFSATTEGGRSIADELENMRF